MSKRSWAAVSTLTYGALVLTGALAGPGAKTPTGGREGPSSAKAGKDLFRTTEVWQLHLEADAKEWAKMQPAGRMRFPGFPGGPGGPPPDPPATPPDTHKGNGFGMEYPWAHGAITVGGQTYKNVGIRYKGNASYMASSRGLKRNLKIAFDHYEKGRRYHGLKKLNLNAGAMDPARMREALAFAVFRAAGVPAPRTAYAEVTLTLAGKYDRERLGLYTVIEQVDRVFLKDRFGDGKGLLMKPEGVRGIEYLGDDWERYRGRYKPKQPASKKQARRVIAFAKLIHQAGDEQFRKEIGSYLDVDEFLRFLAVNALVVNMDSMFGMGHNYYLYLNPKTNQFVFIPWDLDLSLAAIPFGGAPDQLLDLSVYHPHRGEHKLIDRLLAMKVVKARYQKILKELTTTCFTKERLLKDVEALDRATKEPLARERKAVAARKEGPGGFGPPRGGPPGGGPFGRSPDLRTFVEKRTTLVAAQVAGKSKGYVPTGFGPGGRPGGFGMGNFLARPFMQAVDTDKDGKVTQDELTAGVERFFKECDKEKSGSLTERQIAEGINRLMPRPRGFGPPGFGPGGRPGGPGGRPPGGPGGFGPGTFVAGPIVRRADTNKDGKVTREELLAAAKALFREADKEKKGKLDERAVAAGINLLFPPPRFGPGGFGMGNMLARPLFQALDADKDGKVTKDELTAGVKRFFKVCDKEKKGSVDEKAIAEGINRLMPAPPGFGPPGFGPPGGRGGRPGFGPGTFVAGAIVRRADANKDGKVTQEELLAVAEALFKEFDKERKGSLDERQLGAALGLLFPPPPGFGPPGGPRPGFGPPGGPPREARKEGRP